MRIAIVTTEDLFYVRYFFEKFFPLAEKSEYSIEAITILPAFKKTLWGLIVQMWGFYGPYYFFKMGFRYVWRKLTKKTITSLALSYDIPHRAFESVNSEAYISWLKDNEIDAIVSIASPEIFKTELLNAVPKGCINSHSALLPENKGMMPVFWALKKGSTELGVTIHSMEEKLDSGDIFKQVTVPNDGSSLDEMIMRTKALSATLMDEVLVAMCQGTETSTPMPSGGSYQTFPTPKEVKEFLKAGNRHF